MHSICEGCLNTQGKNLADHESNLSLYFQKVYFLDSFCTVHCEINMFFTKILIDTKYLMMLIRPQNGERGVSNLH